MVSLKDKLGQSVSYGDTVLFSYSPGRRQDILNRRLELGTVVGLHDNIGLLAIQSNKMDINKNLSFHALSENCLLIPDHLANTPPNTEIDITDKTAIPVDMFGVKLNLHDWVACHDSRNYFQDSGSVLISSVYYLSPDWIGISGNGIGLIYNKWSSVVNLMDFPGLFPYLAVNL